MNVLVYGSGAREHIIAKKISQSKYLSKLFLAKPNDGFKDLGQVVEFCDFDDLAKKCSEYKVDLAIIGLKIRLQTVLLIF
ncbi:MAG: phosphoribosylamine--glycine ligase family protein [Candidatus Melainabacteria bacterium]|nr:MAG: phosphoribosylamine--glycine ligase family protein [Candidatus Melainabacteria bacterium]